jgi:nucleolin
MNSPESKTCFIGNLSFTTEVEALREAFQDCGEIKDVRVARDPEGNVLTYLII